MKYSRITVVFGISDVPHSARSVTRRARQGRRLEAAECSVEVSVSGD